MVIHSLRSVCIFIKLGLAVNDKHTKSIKHKVIWIKTRLSLIFKGVQQTRVPIGLYQIHLSLNHKRNLATHGKKNKQHSKEIKPIEFRRVGVALQFDSISVLPFHVLLVFRDLFSQNVMFFSLPIRDSSFLCIPDVNWLL